MLIRRELPIEAGAVRSIHATAFARPGYEEPIEAPLLDALRADPAWLPVLSLVAVEDDVLVGHIALTRARLETGTQDLAVLALGPVAVLHDRQRRGIGSALVNAVCVAADVLDERVVVLLGDPAFYGRLGFRSASSIGITPPVEAWEAHFQARPLTAHDSRRDRGRFHYPAPFDAAS